MTTIIAIETTDGVEIGCDSQATGNDKIQMEQPKIFVNNGAVYGVAGVALLANELRFAEIPAPPDDPGDTDKWMTLDFIPILRGILEAVAPKRDEDDFEMHLIVIANNRAYEVGGNAGWIRTTSGVYTVGSGGQFALGALSAGATLTEALEIAAKHDPYTGYKLTTSTAAQLLAA